MGWCWQKNVACPVSVRFPPPPVSRLALAPAEGHITIEALADNGRLRISATDDGTGISIPG